MAIRVLLVDDHSVVRQGLRLARELRPDVVVMDGITAIGHLRRELPDTEVIALTSVLEDDKVIGAVRAGAIGYLLKDTQADELIRAIKGPPPGRHSSPARRRSA